ncbi:MAG: DNA repair protein RadC [Verrucomicrobiales bacterium]
MKIQELPQEDMPREKLLRLGPEALSDAELLALLVRTGFKGKDVLEVCRDLIQHAGDLVNLGRMSPQEIQSKSKGIGKAKSCELAAVFELGRRALRQQIYKDKIDSPEAVYQLMAHQMSTLRREALQVILLNTRHRLMRVETVSLGSVNESIADPREVFREAIIQGAFAIILVHNHPSGDPSPSEMDRTLTKRMAQVADMLRIRLLDHIIIGQPSPDHQPYFSFKEAGLM